jgi:hypothetical protein
MDADIYEQLTIINNNLEMIKIFITAIFLFLVLKVFFNFLSSILFG